MNTAANAIKVLTTGATTITAPVAGTLGEMSRPHSKRQASEEDERGAKFKGGCAGGRAA